MVFCGPYAMNAPTIFNFWKVAFVSLVSFLPLRTHSIRPMLCENENIKVEVLANSVESKLSLFSKKFPLKILSTESEIGNKFGDYEILITVKIFF